MADGNHHNFFSSIKGSIKGRLARSASSSSRRSSASDTRGMNPSFPASPLIPAASQEPPPAYQAAPPIPPPQSHYALPTRYSATTTRYSASAANAGAGEDQYAFLKKFDTVFLIDDSASMYGRSWGEVQSALSFIAPLCTHHDKDGVDIYFLNHRYAGSLRSGNKYVEDTNKAAGKAAGGYAGVKRSDTVHSIFTSVQPGGSTPTGTRLNHILKAYLRHYEDAIRTAGGDPDDTAVKPMNVIVITDGVPTDDPESVLLSVAQKLDRLEAPPHQVGVQFFQVGNEPGAAEALRVLDDDLAKLGGGVRDIVDTVTFNGTAGSMPVLSADGILKTVLGAVKKPIDRVKLQP